MIIGEERLFIIESPDTPQGIKEFFLKFMGKDQHGLKMKGVFPGAWTIEAGRISGPLLFDEDGVYEAVRMDYEKNTIWINRVFITI